MAAVEARIETNRASWYLIRACRSPVTWPPTRASGSGAAFQART